MNVAPYNDPSNQSLQAQMKNATVEFLRNGAALSEKAVVLSVNGNMVKVQPLTQLIDTNGKDTMQPPVEVPAAMLGGGGGAFRISLQAGDIGVLLVPIRNDGRWDFSGEPISPKNRRLFDMTSAIFIPLAGKENESWLVEAGIGGIEITALEVRINSDAPMTIKAPIVTIVGQLIVTQSVQTPLLATGGIIATTGVPSLAIDSPVTFASTSNFTGAMTGQNATFNAGLVVNGNLVTGGINITDHGHTSSQVGTRTSNPVT